eukprot:TRINITY_DN9879_c0_g1_i1.p1 TRINITY_DN9879_c0_g1~~TRINITY_DN9879_c0_g1_i1.p1  ORF type:complete len:525 (+),score=69.38 TRINITY_DN9879_c0_g1_i1:53-1576(+)
MTADAQSRSQGFSESGSTLAPSSPPAHALQNESRWESNSKLAPPSPPAHTIQHESRWEERSGESQQISSYTTQSNWRREESQPLSTYTTRSWREEDPAWMAMSRETKDTERGLEHVPRWKVAHASAQDRHIEMDRSCAKVSKKRIRFQSGSTVLDKTAEDLLEDIVEVLFDYPELLLRIECIRCDSEDEDEALSLHRGNTVANALTNLGACNTIRSVIDQGVETSQGRFGLVRIIPYAMSRLMENPQDRINTILQKKTFDYDSEAQKLTFSGERVASLCARALREAEGDIVIYIPMFTPDIEVAKYECIRTIFLNFGIKQDVILRRRTTSEPGPIIEIMDAEGMIDFADPQAQLLNILKSTPFAFVRGGVEIVADCAPVVSRCADVLSTVPPYTRCCRIDVYPGNTSDEVQGAAAALPLKRAKYLAEQLTKLGVHVPMKSRGHTAPFGSNPMDLSARRGAVVQPRMVGPHVTMTLEEPPCRQAGIISIEDADKSQHQQCVLLQCPRN